MEGCKLPKKQFEKIPSTQRMSMSRPRGPPPAQPMNANRAMQNTPVKSCKTLGTKKNKRKKEKTYESSQQERIGHV